MRHGRAHKKLNKTSTHRKAMMINMANALIKHEQIKTTLPKAKNLRPYVEKLITKAKKAEKNLSTRRQLISILQDEAMVKKLIEVIAKRYEKRPGGYTRVLKAGNRFGDMAPVAYIELVERDINAKGQDSGPKPEFNDEDFDPSTLPPELQQAAAAQA